MESAVAGLWLRRLVVVTSVGTATFGSALALDHNAHKTLQKTTPPSTLSTNAASATAEIKAASESALREISNLIACPKIDPKHKPQLYPFDTQVYYMGRIFQAYKNVTLKTMDRLKLNRDEMQEVQKQLGTKYFEEISRQKIGMLFRNPALTPNLAENSDGNLLDQLGSSSAKAIHAIFDSSAVRFAQDPAASAELVRSGEILNERPGTTLKRPYNVDGNPTTYAGILEFQNFFSKMREVSPILYTQNLRPRGLSGEGSERCQSLDDGKTAHERWEEPQIAKRIAQKDPASPTPTPSPAAASQSKPSASPPTLPSPEIKTTPPGKDDFVNYNDALFEELLQKTPAIPADKSLLLKFKNEKPDTGYDPETHPKKYARALAKKSKELLDQRINERWNTIKNDSRLNEQQKYYLAWVANFSKYYDVTDSNNDILFNLLVKGDQSPQRMDIKTLRTLQTNGKQRCYACTQPVRPLDLLAPEAEKEKRQDDNNPTATEILKSGGKNFERIRFIHPAKETSELPPEIMFNLAVAFNHLYTTDESVAMPGLLLEPLAYQTNP